MQFWAFEVGMICCAILSKEDLNTNLVVLQLVSYVFNIYSGLSSACSISVGNALGIGYLRWDIASDAEFIPPHCRVSLICGSHKTDFENPFPNFVKAYFPTQGFVPTILHGTGQERTHKLSKMYPQEVETATKQRRWGTYHSPSQQLQDASSWFCFLVYNRLFLTYSLVCQRS